MSYFIQVDIYYRKRFIFIIFSLVFFELSSVGVALEPKKKSPSICMMFGESNRACRKTRCMPLSKPGMVTSGWERRRAWLALTGIALRFTIKRT
jgi:hypothetical protein